MEIEDIPLHNGAVRILRRAHRREANSHGAEQRSKSRNSTVLHGNHYISHAGKHHSQILSGKKTIPQVKKRVMRCFLFVGIQLSGGQKRVGRISFPLEGDALQLNQGGLFLSA